MNDSLLSHYPGDESGKVLSAVADQTQGDNPPQSGSAMRLRQFGELEAVVMDILWSRDQPATVRSVHDELTATRQIAYTTAMSTMDNLFRKGWLQRDKVGLAYHYRPTMSREEHSARVMRTVFESGGDGALILNFFLDQIGDTDSPELRDVIERIAAGGKS